jgi:hypothetical protein
MTRLPKGTGWWSAGQLAARTRRADGHSRHWQAGRGDGDRHIPHLQRKGRGILDQLGCAGHDATARRYPSDGVGWGIVPVARLSIEVG